ncbi:MAG: hypothetical protein U9Q70_10585, partial [Chloroflexota bacterium]|nr:hypothetical protein [Chloroflexota bacterium]
MHIRQWISGVLFSVLLLAGLAAPPAIRAARPSLAKPPDESLLFIENTGQFPAKARFYAPAAGRALWLTPEALWVTTTEGGQTVNLKLSFPGANPSPRLEPFNRLETAVSYYRGQDPANWRTNAPTWGGVRYVELYPGVDLEITGQGNQFVWRLVCRADCQSALRHQADCESASRSQVDCESASRSQADCESASRSQADCESASRHQADCESASRSQVDCESASRHQA